MSKGPWLLLMGDSVEKQSCRHSAYTLLLGVTKLPCPSRDYKHIRHQICILGTSLVVQYLRICLLMQGTQVQFLVCEDPTCRGELSLSQQLLSPRAQSLCAAGEAAAVGSLSTTRKEPPVTATRENPRAATKAQRKQRKKKSILMSQIQSHTFLFSTFPSSTDRTWYLTECIYSLALFHNNKIIQGLSHQKHCQQMY